jgi:hypothetical protein
VLGLGTEEGEGPGTPGPGAGPLSPGRASSLGAPLGGTSMRHSGRVSGIPAQEVYIVGAA